MKFDPTQRFGFLVNEVGRLYGRRFDQLARQQLGLSRAQVRLLGVLAMHEGEPLTQAAIADRLDLSAMTVAGLCDRLEAAGWIRRRPSPTDRRANEIDLQPQARDALEQAMAIGDAVTTHALAGLNTAEQRQLLELLRKAHANLSSSTP
jgi:DNA-binding MarR family transcriptional regulator